MEDFVDLSLISSQYQNTVQKGNLYLGSLSVLNYKLSELKKNHIDCVLTILDDETYEEYDVEKIIKRAKLSAYQRYNSSDHEGSTIFPFFQNAYEFIKTNLEKTNVFVHCQAGMSRSPTIVVAYLMKEKRMSKQEAALDVRKKRKFVHINKTFWDELGKWEKQLKIQQK